MEAGLSLEDFSSETMYLAFRKLPLCRWRYFTLLEKPIQKAVVYLDPEEYHSTWLGNKSIYRTRMALADDGDLIVLAPGVRTFGEDQRIDELIRKFGYRTTPEILDHLKSSRTLMKNLSAAAHLIHGTSEKRFNITYCPGHLSKDEIEGVGYQYADLEKMTTRYNPSILKDGWNTLEDGERVFFVSNPAVGLWAYRGRFQESDSSGASQKKKKAKLTASDEASEDSTSPKRAKTGGE